jgi:hypothetical protein
VILMVDPAKALNLKKSILEGLINNYYDAKKDIFTAPADAVANAVMHFEGQINAIQDVALKQLIASNNKNTTTAAFLLDVVISIVLPVGMAHVVGGIASPFLKRLIDNRKRDLDTLNLVIRNVEVKKLFDTHQNNIASLLEELTPEVSEQAGKLIKGSLKRPMVTVAEELEKQAGKLTGRVSALEFIEHYTPAGREVFTETWEKFVEQKDITKDRKVELIKTLYDKKEKEEQNVFETITKMAAGVRSYSKIQIRFDNLFRRFYQFMNKVIDDPQDLDIITKYFQNQLKLLSNITSIDEVERIFEQFFGVTFWLIYLGHPGEYKRVPPFSEFVKIEEKDLSIYNIENFEGSFRVSLGQDYKWVGRGEGRPLRPEPLLKAKINLNIPYDLALYLTRNFGDKFGTESFFAEAKRKKSFIMIKKGGFGIDAPEPVTILEAKSIKLEKEHLYPKSPYFDPLNDAMDKLIEWFLKIDGDLNKNHELKTILEGKGFKPNLIREFRLPKRR